MALGGFLAGRIGSAVDYEMREHHKVVTAIPALTVAIDSLSKRLDERMGSLETADATLRDAILGERAERSQQLTQIEAKVQAIDQRIDALATAWEAPGSRPQGEPDAGGSARPSG